MRNCLIQRGWENCCIIFQLDFPTLKQSDFTSYLNADRLLLRLECRVATRVSLGAASGTWSPSSALQRRK